MLESLTFNKSNVLTLISSSFLLAGVAITANTLSAQAATGFTFSGSDQGGKGSATMNFTGLGTNSVKVNLWNTSSITLNNGTGINAPAITKFGFNALGDEPQYTSWTLQAFNSDNKLVTIGDSSGTIGGKSSWSFGADKVGKFSFDYLAETQGIKGGLYNPDAIDGLAAKPNYFTQATLTVNFDSAFTLDESSTFVRMQNVGKKGKGSLKMTGTPVEDVPEPLTILGSAMAFGFGSLFKKEYAKKQRVKA